MHEPVLLTSAANHSSSVLNTAKKNSAAEQPSATTSRRALYKSTAHWKSMYSQQFVGVPGSMTQRVQLPAWTAQKPPHVSHRGDFVTENEAAYGRFGDEPRDRLPSWAVEIRPERNVETYSLPSQRRIEWAQRS